MRLGAKPPLFAPSELEALSKAALMDVAWNLAARCSGSADDPRAVLNVLVDEVLVTCGHRRDKLPDFARPGFRW